MMASSEDSTIEASCRADNRRVASSRSHCRRCEMSRKMRTLPETRPSSATIGAALSSIDRSAPSLAIRIV